MCIRLAAANTIKGTVIALITMKITNVIALLITMPSTVTTIYRYYTCQEFTSILIATGVRMMAPASRIIAITMSTAVPSYECNADSMAGRFYRPSVSTGHTASMRSRV